MSRTHIDDLSSPLAIRSMRPVQDFLLLRKIKREKSKGGIYFAENRGETNTECYFGEVVAVGQGETCAYDGAPMTDKQEFKPGDTVLVMKYAGEDVKIVGKEEYRLVRMHGVWAHVQMDKGGNVKRVWPYRQRVLVQWDSEEKTLSGLLYIPNNFASWLRVGTVVDIGPGWIHPKGRFRIPLSVKKGDRVICKRYMGADITVGKEVYRLLDEMQIEAVIEGKGDVDVAVPHPSEKQAEADGGRVMGAGRVSADTYYARGD